jgi:hypothetical protein
MKSGGNQTAEYKKPATTFQKLPSVYGSFCGHDQLVSFD